MSQVAELPDLKFPVADDAIDRMRSEYMPLTIGGIEDREGYEAVRAARIEVKKKRCEVENVRKALNADALSWQKSVNTEAKRITALIEPIEAHLTSEEDAYHAEKERIRKEAELAKMAALQKRLDALMAVGAIRHPSIIEPMNDTDFATFLADCTKEFEEKKAAEAQANADRIAAEEAERARIKAEEERLAVERAELDKIKARQEAELAEARRIADERLAKEREAIEAEKRKQAEEQARLDAEKKRIADEEAERQRNADADRQRREAVELAKREEQERQQREAKEAADRAERERLEKERAERLRPDREKLDGVAALVDAIALPRCTTQEGIHAAALIAELLQSTTDKIREVAKMIGEKPTK